MKFEITHKGNVFTVEIPDTSTFLELKKAIATVSKVPAPMQKLMGRPTPPKDESKTIGECGYKDGTKLMLIGNAVEDVVAVHGDSAAKKEKRAKEFRSLPGNFWSLPPFAGLLADPFVDGRGGTVENGKAAMALLFLDLIMSRINTLGTNLSTLALNNDAANAFDHKFLKLTPEERKILARAHGIIRKGFDLASTASSASSSEEVMLLVQTVINNIKSLPEEEWMIISSGWENLRHMNVIYLLVKKNKAKPSAIYTEDGSGDSFEVVVCNTDTSELGCLDFHPQLPTADKLKAKACLTLPLVCKERLLDESFWLLLLSLTVRANNPDLISEFARGEVIYDVLLPWLYERDPVKVGSNENASSPTSATSAATGINAANSLPRDLSVLLANSEQYRLQKLTAADGTALTSAASPSDFVTPQRSRSGATKALSAALFFLLRKLGMGEEQCKQLEFVIKYEFFLKAAEDLHAAALLHLPPSKPSSGASSAAVGGSNRKVEQLAKAVKFIADLGIDTSGSAPSLSALFEAMGERDYVKSSTNIVLNPTSHFAKKVVAVYFADSKCRQCNRVGPLVVEAYNRLQERIPNAASQIEFLLVSSDESKDKFEDHSAKFPFPRLSWPPSQQVFKAFDITHIPTLLIFSPEGSMLTRDGVTALLSDPEASKFPNAPWNGAKSLTPTDLKMFEYSSSVLAHNALKKFEQSRIDEAQLKAIRDLITAAKNLSDAMPHRADDGTERALLEEDDESSGSTPAETSKLEADVANQHAADVVTPTADFGVSEIGEDASTHPNSGLLNRVSTVKYVGTPYSSSVPNLGDLSNFRPPTDYASLLLMLKQASAHSETLWERARHSGTSSRVAVQIQIIEFITWLFTFIIPIPRPTVQEAVSIDMESLYPADRALLDQFLRPTPNPVRDSVTSDLYFGDLPSSSSGATPTDRNDDPQFAMCDAVYKLMMSYANAWQAVETPSRSFDSERALISVAMLCVFEAIARNTKGASHCLILANLLSDAAGYGGGYRLSTLICKHSVPFKEASSTFELTRPQHLAVRDALISLITFNQLKYPNDLFDLRCPHQIELRKHSHTVNFLRRFLEECGYQLGGAADDDDPNSANNGAAGNRPRQAQAMRGSEMEKLMYWFCDARSPLATDHPEFVMLRDMVLLMKFMATMEPRDTELLTKRKEVDEFAVWRLSFEEDAPGRQMSAGWRTRPRQPYWECLMVRGRDADIADISVKGFGDRTLSSFGESSCVMSPIDVAAKLGLESPQEDDILHAKSLPTFGGVLSQEEAESLWSILTVPYLRIPLLLDFFFTQDRHTYLFTGSMQSLLRAALFEPGAHIPMASESYKTMFNVPLRLNAQQKRDAKIDEATSATAEGDTTRFIGTTFGLLLNELQHSPQPILGPWLHIINTARDLGPSSVYSINATYVLFLCSVSCDLLSFIHYALTMESDDFRCRHGEYLTSSRSAIEASIATLMCPLLSHWLKEAEENDDIPSQCVVHSHLAMVHRAFSLGLSTTDPRRRITLVRLLQSCAFVRARHGFGMGFQRTQLASQDTDADMSAEDKLLRFLQAQGLDTRATNKQMLAQGRQLMMSGGRRRAVFVQIRGRYRTDTVRIPNLFRSDPTSTEESKALKLPPVDVPENLLFSILQEHFFELTAFINGLPAADQQSEASASNGVDHHALLDTSSPCSALSLEPSDFPNLTVTLADVANAIVRTTLKDKVSSSLQRHGPSSPIGRGGAAAQWARSPGSVLVAPAASLVFHLQTCELFWKDEELKPVPDSMSHYADYETILGKDVMQCGLVSRSEHRHWVHVVGTEYDLVEWTEHDPSDQGVHCPSIIIGPPETDTIEHVTYLGTSYTRAVDIHEKMQPWPERAERWAVNLVQQVYRMAFPQPMAYSPILPTDVAVPKVPSLDPSAPSKQVLVDEIRMVCYDKAQYKDEEDKATWKEIVATRVTTVRRLTEKKKKALTLPGPYEGFEVIESESDIRLDVFTLVPHARRMYRVLHYSTSQRDCIAALELIKSKRMHGEYFKALRYQVGRIKSRIKNEGTLEIHRFNTELNGREVFLPPRLLQGVVPSCLLENFLFWHGEDDIIRGYADNSAAASAAITHAADSLPDSSDQKGKNSQQGKGDKEEDKKESAENGAATVTAAKEAFANHWFNYSVEIELGEGAFSVGSKRGNTVATSMNSGGVAISPGTFRLIRRADKKHRPIRPAATATLRQPKQKIKGVADDNEQEETKSMMFPRSESELLHARSAEIDDKTLSTLRTLFCEYPDEVLIYGYKQSKKNVGKTVEWLADPANEPVIKTMLAASEPAPEAPPSTCDNDNPAKATAATARQTSAEMIAGEASMTGMGSRTSSSFTNSATAFGGVGEGDEVEKVTDENLELLRLTDCPQLAKLRQLLTRVEDASHILIWGRRAHNIDATAQHGKESDNSNDPDTTLTTCEVHIIELPRLRAKFQPKSSESGGHLTHLWLVDNPGWRVALTPEVFADERLVRLMEPWEQSVAMMNVTTKEMGLFVPNHDFARLDVVNDPFNRLLLYDRGSVQWSEAVPSPFYLMIIHTSREFLVSPSLAASLYAAVILTARQRYADAFRFIEACYVDTHFSTEEHFMFSLMSRTLESSSMSSKDLHPDAHAARLKFAHAALYSPNEVSWALHEDVSGYVLKRRHVSRCCRLTREELTDLLKKCQRGNPLIRLQLEYWAQLREGKSIAKLTIPDATRPGRPWAKLKAMTYSSVLSNCSKVARVQYKPPSALLHEAELVKWLWSDALFEDAESGANSSLGCYFLYSLMRKVPQCNMKFLGKDSTSTMGPLLSRWFHLRHARWGKETTLFGEVEYRPSYFMLAVADLESFPNAAWPTLTDPATLGQMSRGGISVTQRMDRGWMQRDSFDTGDGRPTPLALFVRDLERCVHDVHRQSARSLPSFPTLDRCRVKAHDYIVPRVIPSDTAQNRVVLMHNGKDHHSRNACMAENTLRSMAGFLFDEIDIFDKFVTVRDPSGSNEEDEAQNNARLPFDVSPHPLAQSLVARDMLRRLENDVQTFENQRKTSTQFLLKMLEDTKSSELFKALWRCEKDDRKSAEEVLEGIQTIATALASLISALSNLSARDNAAVSRLAQELVVVANGIHKTSSSFAPQKRDEKNK